jgi:phosphopentomutase
MARAFLFVLDSFGIGGSVDAGRFGDAGADTFGHIVEACEAGKADRNGLRTGPLFIPNMASLGLFHAASIAKEAPSPGKGPKLARSSFHGAAQEISSGKDTPSGHWEMAGVPVLFDWGYFPDTVPAFPEELTEAMIRDGRVPGILANCHASGTAVIEDFGEEHILTGKPICYTSVDSVLQVAAHEQHFGLERLYEFCETTRRLVDPLNIGRVIARPFAGETRGSFERTPNRRD